MTNQLEAGTFVAMGPVSNVSVHSHMRSGPHSVMGNPVDLAIVVELMFLLAERARTNPGGEAQPVTPQSLLERLRELGVQSGNGSRLIGRDAVYESFARLRAKGYIRRVQLRVNNKSAGVAYEFYEFPAWNPDPPALAAETEFPQVRAASGIAGSGIAGNESQNRTSRSSSQVRAASGIAGSGNAGSRSPKPVSSQVRAASGIAGSPPHPPEGGGGTPPPNPLNRGRAPKADRYTEQCALDPADYQPTAAEVSAADAFLQDLPGKWQMGPDEARMLAPLLASRIHTQGYELDLFLELVLVQDDAANPAKIPSRVMPSRLKNLKRRRAEERPVPASPAAAGGRAEVEWCGQCNDGELPALPYMRLRETAPGRHVPCTECHPKYART
ncbi:hypothetical protein PV518_17770 [Streptomyces sp. ND04-05B]|uniref:hypothetical protein n=1 Tax=Streptomyces sp. ND04-05B TaxID=3028693 RepID=UPI0029AA390A|nr:hypothetical protein [Streptomyces sp. ND04-05B]MDX3064009.1 hypothetical protein [Streptomyces sp. ND04-05B]